jgi:regulator of ribonuclease activity A
MTTSTTDLCDAHCDRLNDGRLAVLAPFYLSFGKRRAFCGHAVTLQVTDDNALVRATLETPGEGRVLVIDGGGSQRCALVGGQLALLAHTSGWNGIIVDGCVRDVDELNAVDIGIRAKAVHPRRGGKLGAGHRDTIIHIAGTHIRPGDWIVADADGILVSREALN